MKNKEQINKNNRLYYEKNKEKRKEKIKEWKTKNKDKVNFYNRKSYEKNKEKLKPTRKKWNEMNSEKLKIYRKDYYKKNKERLDKITTKWQKENKDKRNEYMREYIKEYRLTDKQIKYRKNWWKTEKGKLCRSRNYHKRKEKGFIILIQNPFNEFEAIEWHHIDDSAYVVAIPKDLHKLYCGKYHKDNMMIIVNQIYG